MNEASECFAQLREAFYHVFGIIDCFPGPELRVFPADLRETVFQRYAVPEVAYSDLQFWKL